MKNWDIREKEYIFDHGWRLDKDGMLVLTAKQFREAPYTGRSVRDEKVRTIMLPTVNGSCLILEGLHFRVEG